MNFLAGATDVPLIKSLKFTRAARLSCGEMQRTSCLSTKMADTTMLSNSHSIRLAESKQGPLTDIVSPPRMLPWDGSRVRSVTREGERREKEGEGRGGRREGKRRERQEGGREKGEGGGEGEGREVTVSKVSRNK